MERSRLLVIANSFPDKDDKHPGGVFVKEQVKAVAPHFAEVHVVFPSTLGMSFDPRGDFKDYSLGNVHVHFLSYFNVPLFLRVFRTGFIWFMARAIDRLVRREGIKFDIVHAHFTWPSGGAAVRLKASHKAPVVITEHTSIAFNKALASKDPIFLDTWLASNAIVRVKEGDIDRMAEAGVPREKLHFIPNGFDDSMFRPMDRTECRRRLGLSEDKKIVVSIGSLHDFKGHRHLVDAMASIVEERKDVICCIVGDGPMMPALRKQIDTLKLVNHVRLVGTGPYRSVPIWMGASDIVAHPSLSESGPMVMFEALGCGRPFVGTKVGSVPEVIRSEEFGIVCPPGDPLSLSDAIVRGLSKTWDEGKISSYASKYASREVAKELLAVYRGLVGASGNP
ncbi:MAG: glycosyltransferase [Thermoplasmata archaeon]